MPLFQKSGFTKQRIPIRADKLDQTARIRLRNADFFRQTSGKQLLIALLHTAVAILFHWFLLGKPTYGMTFRFME